MDAVHSIYFFCLKIKKGAREGTFGKYLKFEIIRSGNIREPFLTSFQDDF